MKKKVLLVYVHGFKGGANTFEAFPRDIEQRLQRIFTNTAVATMLYPPYETRGELAQCVSEFLSYLETTVIDAEIAQSDSDKSSSPVISPSVGVVLVAHSMGGLVVADAALQILARDLRCTFPKVLGMLCFDTPFLGLHASVFSQDAVQRGAAKMQELKTLSASLPVGAVTSYLFAKKSSEQPARAANAAGDKNQQQKKEQVNWGKVIGLTAAGIATTAAAAAGAAWYLKSQNVDLGWAKQHLEFVGALMQPADTLKKRLYTIYDNRARVQMVNFYTVIRDKQQQQQQQVASQGSNIDIAGIAKSIGRFASSDGDGKRTFCVVPKESPYSDFFVAAENSAATGEIEAHISMFDKSKNPGYSALVSQSSEIASGWISAWVNER
ncbi:uncharacterized protein V1518DRAFT_146178 [Limtongia smithiae]|uniref:uncharacterized protein n=1 Tax=Limtongia smithiae TaxID=1125753 RepID=UPI0034CD93AB